MITKLHTSYIKDGYIFECKVEDMNLYCELGTTLSKHNIDYCLEHLKNKYNIYKVTQI